MAGAGDTAMEVDATSTSLQTLPSVYIQHDWIKAIECVCLQRHFSTVCFNRSQNDESFFVGIRKPEEQKTQFADIKLDANGKATNELFECEKRGARALNVTVKSLGVNKTFVAPSAELETLHKSAIAAIDVSTHNNLGISAEDDLIKVWNSNTGEYLVRFAADIHSILLIYLISSERSKSAYHDGHNL